MKVAVVGSTGYIAQYIIRRFSNEREIDKILRIDRSADADVYLDLLETSKFDYRYLDDIDYIVFTAAVSGPDQCANDFDVCWTINVEGTKYFIHEALERKCRVLFFSSDAVFGDIPGAIYYENSDTKAYTPYGRMKKAIEDEFKNDSGFKAIRLSYVVSADDRFTKYCLNCIRNNEVADIFHPFYRNATVITDVIDIVVFFAFKWKEYAHTFLNVAGKELVSRVRIADEINRLYGGKLKYKITMPGKEFFANRPMITQMQSLYIDEYGIVKDNSFTEKIAKEMEKIEV